jgi:hypothetical protein
MALKRMCKCGKFIDYSVKYCDECADKVNQYKKQRNSYYDKTIRQGRDKIYHDFYQSKEWQITREIVLNKYNGIDVYAYYVEGLIQYANTVHHIEEIKDDWGLRLDLYNLIPLTDSTHKKIHGLYINNKEDTQRLLRELKIKWEEEFGGK